MQLWTDYEGHTIDGAFLLEKLLLSEGRSAFFSTSNGAGIPKLIRLIASHFDEEEILSRWRSIQALDHPNILKIEQYGQVELDDTTVVYALFESADAGLGDVLASQRLTVPEAKQLALSVATALDALHKNGFVHEHVEPSKVFAVGEVVKLRGDCIREAPEGQRGEDARKKDVHDLASLSLLALAQTYSLEEATRITSLPSWLIELVRNGRSGAWGLPQILPALGAVKPTAAVPPAPRPADAPEKPKEPAIAAEKAPSTQAAPKLTAIPVATPAPPRPPVQEKVSAPPPIDAKDKDRPARLEPDRSERFVPPGRRQLLEDEEIERKSPFSAKSTVLIALAILLAFWLIWRVLHRSTTASAPQQSSASSAPAPSPGSLPGATHANTKPAPAKPSAAAHATRAQSAPLPQSNAAAANHEQWRVIAFTYNHQDQAQQKADTIAQHHADLRPEVFTP
ncbi:MAG TPA: hypothetical protein VL346_10820, partial [Acidobacteriaceae bacterium]|nr:hypothetical protein [Acidobacteriaceae bacterium]